MSGPLRMRPCDRCGRWAHMEDGVLCQPCGVGAEETAVADLEREERRRSQAALEEWLGISTVPAGGAR